MKDQFLITDTFIESISGFDKNMKASLWKCLGLLRRNCFHRSLNTEKLNGIYSSRINIDYRLIHEPSVKLYRLLYAGKHDDAYRFADNYKRQVEIVGKKQRFIIREKGLFYDYDIEAKAGLKKIAPKRALRYLITQTVSGLRKPKLQEELVAYKIYSLRKLKRFFSQGG